MPEIISKGSGMLFEIVSNSDELIYFLNLPARLRNICLTLQCKNNFWQLKKLRIYINDGYLETGENTIHVIH